MKDYFKNEYNKENKRPKPKVAYPKKKAEPRIPIKRSFNGNNIALGAGAALAGYGVYKVGKHFYDKHQEKKRKLQGVNNNGINQNISKKAN